jgi:hypothetical protein
MMEMIQKLAKKKGKDDELDPMYKDAKMGVLKDIHKMASDSMADDVKGMKKVTVASPDEEGLEKGLDKAKELLNSSPEDAEDDSEDEQGDDKKPDAADILENEIEHESDEGDLSDDEIDEMIKLLQEKKAKSASKPMA